MRLKAQHKRRALETLPRGRLADLCGRFDIEVLDRRARRALIDGLVRQRRVPFEQILGALKREELKAVCESLDLDPTGRDKATLVGRILLGPSPAPARDTERPAVDEATPGPLRPQGKRITLLTLSRERLAELTDAFGIRVGDRRARRSFVDALVRTRSLDFTELLTTCTRAELKAMCEALGRSVIGREKRVLVDRIVGASARPKAVAQPALASEALPPATPPSAPEAAATPLPDPTTIDFPLIGRAITAGVLDGESALIVAPTATGKSTIGRRLIREAVERGTGGRPCAYLVPFRALAWEMFEQLCDTLGRAAPSARVQIATGDATDPVEPDRADVLVATYESFQALMLGHRMHPKVLVVDEVHLLADETRGPPLEMLLAGMRDLDDVQLCALSAVIEDPAPLATWLGAKIVTGGPEDRAVPVSFGVEATGDLDEALARAVAGAAQAGRSVLAFCASKATAERAATALGEVVAPTVDRDDEERLYALRYELKDAELGADKLADLVPTGVAFHHAGLLRGARSRVERAYRDRAIRVIACTPTLAAGVNLPAELVVLRDVFRREPRRGRYLNVQIPTSEVLNMLGRAGRPGQAERGRGIVLVKEGTLDDGERKALATALARGKGAPVRSRMPDRFEWLMRLALREAAAHGEVTAGDLKDALERTLWHAEAPNPIELDRPLVEDLMEDIPAFARADGLELVAHEAEPDGVVGAVRSGDHEYGIAIRLTGLDCECEARRRWQRDKVCKHLARAIHTLLFEPAIDADSRQRAMYACLHLFRRTLDLGTKLREALDILVDWELLDRTSIGYRSTAAGDVAAYSGLDLLLVRDGFHRVAKAPEDVSPHEVAAWTIEDFFGDPAERARWRATLEPWLAERPMKDVPLPTSHRGQMESGLDRLGGVAVLYGRVARALGNPGLAGAAERARACLRHGVLPDAIPLASLNIPKLRRRNCRYLIEQHEIRTVDDLAQAIPAKLADPKRVLSVEQCTAWVERARAIASARVEASAAPPETRQSELDGLLARFRVEAIALEPR